MDTGSSSTKHLPTVAGEPGMQPSVVVSPSSGRTGRSSVPLPWLDVRVLQSPQAREIYITARPTERGSAAQQGRRIFRSIRDLLARQNAWICLERIFAPGADLPALREIRKQEYGVVDDGVEPTFLIAEDAPGIMPGVQVYAIQAAEKPRIISAADAKGRVFNIQGCRWVAASALRGPWSEEGPMQARAAFQKAESLLAHAGGDLRSVARTWIFMKDILSWYHQFNQARNDVFRRQGLLATEGAVWLPASTGIGVSPADDFRCAIELLAVVGPEGSVASHKAAGRQKSAHEYGSAFARAAVARTPAGTTVFVSGTAAIDASGASCHPGDIAGQIRMTLENVTAVLQQLSVHTEDAVQAIAYCTSPTVRDEFLSRWACRLPWPWLVTIGDICRDDLLFEVEVTVCPGAKSIV
jgi:enamine deaminase RidA (YjgF/YER057c/UK114 family)